MSSLATSCLCTLEPITCGANRHAGNANRFVRAAEIRDALDRQELMEAIEPSPVRHRCHTGAPRPLSSRSKTFIPMFYFLDLIRVAGAVAPFAPDVKRIYSASID